MYYERKKLKINVEKIEKELRENDIQIDKDYIKEFYEKHASTKLFIEKGEG